MNEIASDLARTAVGASPLAAKFPAKFTPNETGLIIEREWLRLAET